MSEEISRIQKLQEERLNAWEQSKALNDIADNEKRDFTAEEKETWDKLTKRMGEIDERVKAYVEDEKRAKDSEAAFAGLLAKPETAAPQAPEGESDLRKWINGQMGREIEFKADKHKTLAEYRTPLVTTTNSAGGYTVPISFYDRLIAHLIENSGLMMAGPTLLNTNSGEQLQIPKTTAHSTAVIVTQGAGITESEPAFGQVSLSAYKYGILLQVARELTTDTAVDLEGYLSMQAGRALGNGFGVHAVTGTGGGVQPTGALTQASLGVTGGTVAAQNTATGRTDGFIGAFTADDLISLFYSVIYPYRNSPSCGWLMKDATIGNVRKLKSTQGNYIWEPSVQVGAPDTILSKPVHQDPNMPAEATAGKSVLFGDFSQYFVRWVNGIRFERSDDYAFNADVITYRALLRADGNLIDTTGALKYFIGGTA
jgi:HK97 family phage major capsid protein